MDRPPRAPAHMTRTLPSDPPAARRVRVAHLGPDPRDGGGMPAVVAGLMASPLADLHDLTVIATHQRGSMSHRLIVFAKALVALTAFCLRGGDRVVHLHTTVRGSMYRKAICTMLAKALRAPVVLQVHVGEPELEYFRGRVDKMSLAAFRWAFSHADRVLSVGTASAREVEEHYSARDVEVLPNAAPPPVDGPLSGPALPGRARLLYIGGFHDPVKGGEVLLDALPAILERHPGVRVTIAGPGEPPGRMGDVNGSAEWLGWLDADAKAKALREADVFLMPSTSEGLPVALLEAMAYGKPIVATRVGGIPDVLADGREGLLVPPGDVAALADAVGTLVADPQRALELGRAAKQRVAELGPDTIAKRLDLVYQEVIRGG
jgi:glycosyltransferase involved in cell wall biosynthesis